MNSRVGRDDQRRALAAADRATPRRRPEPRPRERTTGVPPRRPADRRRGQAGPFGANLASVLGLRPRPSHVSTSWRRTVTRIPSPSVASGRSTRTALTSVRAHPGHHEEHASVGLVRARARAGGEDRGEVPGPDRPRVCPRPRSPVIRRSPAQDPGGPFASGARFSGKAGAEARCGHRGCGARRCVDWSWSSARSTGEAATLTGVGQT